MTRAGNAAAAGGVPRFSGRCVRFSGRHRPVADAVCPPVMPRDSRDAAAAGLPVA